MFDLTTARMRIVYMLLLVIAVNFILYMEYRRRVDLVYLMMGREAEDTASLIARLITRQYSKEYMTVLRTMDSSTPEYNTLKHFLIDCREASKYKFAYTFKFINHGKHAVFIVDSEHNNSPLKKPIGSVKDINQNSGILKYLGSLPVPIGGHDAVPYSTNIGTFISGYSPINGDDGWGAVGYVGVDIDKTTLEAIIAPKTIMFMTTTGLINLVFLITVMFMAYVYKKSIATQRMKNELVLTYLHNFDKSIKDRLVRKQCKTDGD